MHRPETPGSPSPAPDRPEPYAYPAAGAGASDPRPGGPDRVDPQPGRQRTGPPPGAADAVALLVGAWLVVAPFALGYDRGGSEAVATVNDIASGVAVALLAALGLVGRFRRPALRVAQVVLGVWLLAAPFVLFYSAGSAGSAAPAATWNDLLAGTAVVALAVVAAAPGRSQGARQVALRDAREPR